MQELELHVNTENEKLLIGADYIILNDESTSTFETDDIAEFIDYAKSEDRDILIYYSANKMEMFLDSGVFYTTKPLAVCHVKFSDQLDIITGVNKKKLTLEAAQVFLRRMTKYLDKTGILLKDNLENLKIRKILNIDIKKDNQGNFLYSVEQDKAKDDYIFPDSIIISVPLLDYSDDVVDINLDFFFSHTLSDSGVSVSVVFDNIEFHKIIRAELRKLLKKKLSSFKKVYYGECYITRQHNSWQYQQNKLEK